MEYYACLMHFTIFPEFFSKKKYHISNSERSYLKGNIQLDMIENENNISKDLIE